MLIPMNSGSTKSKLDDIVKPIHLATFTLHIRKGKSVTIHYNFHIHDKGGNEIWHMKVN